MKTRKQAVRAAVLAAAAVGMVMAVAPANAMLRDYDFNGRQLVVGRAQYRPMWDRAAQTSIRQARVGATWLHVPMIDWDTLPLLLPGPVQQVSGDF